MKFSIARTDDLEETRELHAVAFPEDSWVGDDHEYWVARNARKNVVGFATAIYWPDTGVVFLSRAAIVQAALGHGLHRRLIRARVSWARRLGAKAVVTYTTLRNYKSISNLVREGFTFYPQKDWKAYHWFYLKLDQTTDVDSLLKTSMTKATVSDDE